ncbi:MAG: 30S ribosomal protein S8 [Acidobacteria bacterium]|nr:30S ribosomal protein S8 [Acidobacteriota bacterium]
MMTDPIADMLTRIKNAIRARQESVDIPGSRLKLEILKILKDEGYLDNYKFTKDNKQGTITVFLKYGANKESVITELERVSRPGRRVYAPKEGIPAVMGGLGVSILSTPKGVMTGKRAKQEGVGGEILCQVH